MTRSGRGGVVEGRPYDSPVSERESPHGPASGGSGDPHRTARIPRVESTPGDGSRGGLRARRPWLVGAAVVGLVLVLYVGDLLLSSTDVPRGVAVGGVAIGGMSKPDARALMTEAFAARTARPVSVRAGDTIATVEPAAVGLGVDVGATVERAGEQPLAPWTRIASLFGTRTVDPVSTGTRATIVGALEALRPQLDRAPVEGTVAFRGAEPYAVPSRTGQTVDTAAGADAVLAHWLDPLPVALPVIVTPVTVTREAIEDALRDVARPATLAPLVVVGDGANATLAPAEIGRVLTFVPDPNGGLAPRVDLATCRGLLAPRLEGTETEAKDATFAFAGDTPTVVPAVTGRAVDWERTLAGLVPALGRPADAAPPPTTTRPPAPDGAPQPDPLAPTGRAVGAVYVSTAPEVTTAALEAIGAPVVVGEFETRGFAADSGRNIRRVAEQVDGAAVGAGATFSLNGFTGPRDASQGYVEAGIIDDGAPGRGLGGGISQFATTLYNASYFAGLVDIEHSEHSYYISRYPPGREATVFEGSIDLRFRNDGPTPVLIRTLWTPSTIKVQIYGQKRVEVTSSQGPRFAPTPPGTRDLSDRPTCTASGGVAGFSITDTRTIRDLATGEIRTQARTVRYEPQPAVTCGGT